MLMLKRRGLVWLVLGAVVIFSGYKAGGEFWKWFGLWREYRALQREVNAINRQAQSLKLDLADLTDPAVLEKEARTRLNLKKEGEAVLVVVSEADFPQEDFTAILNNRPDQSSSPLWGNVGEWGRYFFP